MEAREGIDQGKYWGENVPFFVDGYDPTGVSSDVVRDMYKKWNNHRYACEPHILDLIHQWSIGVEKVLEVGVGAGMDFSRIAALCSDAHGVDLSDKNVERTKCALDTFGLKGTVQQGSALELPFEDETFDGVYSYGVLHHTGDTQKAIDECFRVLKSGGKFGIMLYHKWWGTRLTELLFKFMPGSMYDDRAIVDVYTSKEVRDLLSKFKEENVWYSTPKGFSPSLRDRIFWFAMECVPFFEKLMTGSFMLVLVEKP